jgi:pimeloyl-ACP methyl ester carboxylesterase
MTPKLIPIYLMPGMAANPTIFDNLNLNEEEFEVVKLEWFVPEEKMSLQSYAKKMCDFVQHVDPVLIGVSFGGVLVQEMAKIISVRNLIIISSVKSKGELPLKMQLAKKTKAYKLLPTHLVSNIEWFSKYAFGENIEKRLALYEKYLSVSDPAYLNWAIKEMVCWNQEYPLEGIVHIHGDKDPVFPIKKIKNCIRIENGSHIMIINKSYRIRQEIRRIILENP